MRGHRFSEKILSLLKAPGGGDDTNLEQIEEGLRCVETGELYPYIDGIPSLYQPTEGEGAEVTSKVKSC